MKFKVELTWIAGDQEEVGVLGATEQKTGLSRSHRNFDSCGAWSNR